MKEILAVFKREIGSFFATPVAYIFIFVFLAMSGVFTFLIGDFYTRGQADLLSFFSFHPWLYLFLVPAISMRMWAEERKLGTVELLMTLPVTPTQLVIAKFAAGWTILGISLSLTFPVWLTVNYLGEPDNGVILIAYFASWLMSGAYLAIGLCMSALTRNQITAFILAVVICFLFVLIGSPIITELLTEHASNLIIDTVASFSFLTNFQDLSKGVIKANNILFFVLFIALWLYSSFVIVDQRKGL